MLGDQDLLTQQHRVHRTRAPVGVIDVERIDPHQHRAGVTQPHGGLLGEIGVPLEVRVGAPEGVPSRVDQHGFTLHVGRRELRRNVGHVDRAPVARDGAHHEGGLIHESLERH